MLCVPFNLPMFPSTGYSCRWVPREESPPGAAASGGRGSQRERELYGAEYLNLLPSPHWTTPLALRPLGLPCHLVLSCAAYALEESRTLFLAGAASTDIEGHQPLLIHTPASQLPSSVVILHASWFTSVSESDNCDTYTHILHHTHTDTQTSTHT